MDKEKVDAAVLVMKALTPEERAAVNYTVEREAKKRAHRRTKVPEVRPPISVERDTIEA